MIFTFKFHLILYYYYIIYIQFQQINDFFVLRVMVFQVFLLFVYICIAIKYPIIKKGRVGSYQPVSVGPGPVCVCVFYDLR